ncbi:MAG: hypothetical protein JXR85_02995 [Deltaproteobacteria bacterium]|nr:hypothetical protein [Deltaproteobacteria bacterium]
MILPKRACPNFIAAAGTVWDSDDRLNHLRCLPQCDWWVLESWEEGSLLQTRDVVRSFMDGKFL